MNTKISENQSKVISTRRALRDEARFPGKAYFIILITTIILLIAFLISFLVVFFREDSSESEFSPEWNFDNNTTQNIDTTQKSIGGNLPGKTVAKRSSYLSTTGSNVSYISDAIGARNVILIDLDTYSSIAEKSADTKIYPASMTKVMSLLVACENLQSLGKTFEITQDVVDYSIQMGGSGVGLKVGDVLSAQDLLYLTAYQSDTIAIITLANHIAGSEADFVKMMNNKVAQLGLKNTNFANSTGLHDPNNYTTCREMAAILAYALENPLCRELLTNYKGYRAGDKYMVYSSWYSGRFDDNPRLNTVTVSGGKTGYIDESGFCLASYAVGRSNGKQYIQVIVGQPKGSGYREDISVRDIKYVYNNFAK